MADTFIVTVHCSNCRTTCDRSFPVGTVFEQTWSYDGHLLDVTERKPWHPGEPWAPPTKITCALCGVGVLTRRERTIEAVPSESLEGSEVGRG